MASTGIATYWSVITGITFLITLALFVYSAFKGYWIEQEAPKSVRISLPICATLYALAIFFAFLFNLFMATFGYNSSLNDPRQHDAVIPVNLLWIFFYLASIVFNLFVWIQRLQYIYINSVYGMSSKITKALKIVWLIVVLLAFVVFALNLFARLSQAGAVFTLRFGIVFLISFALLFAAEATAVSVVYIKKLRSMRKVLDERASQADEQEAELIAVGDLVHLQVKMTILVCVQVISTPLSLLAAPIVTRIDGIGEAATAFVSIDAFIGFLCVYCTLANHQAVFDRVCCLCVGCCKSCGYTTETKTVEATTAATSSSDVPMATVQTP